MKKLMQLSLVILAVLSIAFTGCKKDDIVTPETSYETLSKYVAQNNLDLPTIVSGFTKSGSQININMTDFSVPDYFVIDVRAAADYNTGHIKNAVNVPIANLLEAVASVPKDQNILVTCYTGQTASRAVVALRMMGYTKVYSLKWGMASWHADFASRWDSKVANVTSPGWVNTGAPTVSTTGALPTFTSTATTGDKILEEWVKATLANTSWTVNRDDVLANPGNYFINNYWPAVSWDAFGHFAGAYRIFEDLKVENLGLLRTDKPLVTYCYTGQTSGIVTTWLQIMGYDNARSLSFGANAIVYDQLKVSAVDDAKKKSWKGEGSGSANNFGYYDSTNTMHNPL